MHGRNLVVWAALAALSVTACHGHKTEPQGSGTTVDPNNPNALALSAYGLDVRPANGNCQAPNALSAGDGSVMLQPVFTNLTLNVPLMMKQAPGNAASRWYLVERGGLISSFPAQDNVQASDRKTLIDLTAQVNTAGEGGTLGLALHPQFASNGKFYVSYTSTGPDNAHPLTSHLSQFVAVDDMAQGGETALLTLDQPYTNHKGGDIHFGRDGDLYLGFGDGGDGNDPGQRAQNPNLWFGKMLRLNVDTPANGNNYSIPADNPYAVSGAGLKEIYALGLRNPWRWSFDRETGQMWVGDVGQDHYEEIDLLTRGNNYGWRIREGFHCNTAVVEDCNTTGLTDPIFEYPHTDGQCIVGGYVYRGAAIQSLYGAYIYGDCVAGHVWSLTRDPNSGAYTSALLTEVGDQINSFAEGEDGEIYVLTASRVQRIAPATQANPNSFPQRLSAVGCFDPNQPTQPGTALIPYTVNAALWADGASKQRWVMFPSGASAHVEDDGHITLPVGAMLFKEFSVDGKRVETRMLVHHSADTWGTYTYAWDDGETDATLQGASSTRALDANKSWTYPSRGQCSQCHTRVAQESLGMQTAQLNGAVDYPSTGRRANQIATWQHLGLFDTPQDPNTLQTLPAPQGTDPVEARARAYLHANCAFCHQPNGTGQGPADFRFSTPLAAMGVCNAAPQEGTLGVAGALLLKPGAPSQSLISLRMHATTDDRMPPLASQVVDPDGTAVVDAWIASLTACP